MCCSLLSFLYNPRGRPGGGIFVVVIGPRETMVISQRYDSQYLISSSPSIVHTLAIYGFICKKKDPDPDILGTMY